jgi:hypothetical protein
MIVQDREPRDGHREDFSTFLEPMLDPAFAVVHPFAEQEGPSHAARYTVVRASYGRINEMGTRNRHGRISWDDPHKLPMKMPAVHLVGRGDKTPLELFLANLNDWPNSVRRLP